MSLELYFASGVALAILGRVIHYRVITRYLKSRGLAVAKGSSLSDWRDWKAYRAARLSEKQPITWWYVLWAMHVVLLFWVAGWICEGLGVIKIEAYSHFAERAADSSGDTTVFDVTQAGSGNGGFQRSDWFSWLPASPRAPLSGLAFSARSLPG